MTSGVIYSVEPFGLSDLEIEYIVMLIIIFLIGPIFRVTAYLIIAFIGIHLENFGVPESIAYPLIYGSCGWLYFSRVKKKRLKRAERASPALRSAGSAL